MEQQFAQTAEQQLASERKKIASLNLFPEEERKKIVNKILILTEPLLIDEDNNVRIEGREIISDLSKAVGLATMIDVMRPNCDCIDEYVRNTAAQSFSVVASALGIPAMLPFLEEVCHSEKSWQAPHTGIMFVHHIAILIRSAALLVGSIAISTTFGVFDGNY